MLLFKKVRWKNFLSTGNLFTEVSLNDSRTTLISGLNGHGKSTILDVLAFSLFGKTFRNINLPQLPNSINQKNCLVELEFEANGSEYLVRRGLEPKIFEIYKNDSLVEQSAKAKDYQRQFEETVLRMSFKAFCQVVILGSSNYVPFMRLSAADRRSIVESILDIDVFTAMNTILKSRISENRDMLKNMSHKLELHQEKIRSQRNILDNIRSMSEDAIRKNMEEIEKCETKLSHLSTKIDSITTSVKQLRSTIEDSESVSRKLNKILELEKNIQKQMKSITQKIESVESMTHCSSCNQEIGEDFKRRILTEKTNKLGEMEKAMEELEKRKSDSTTRKIEIDSVKENIQEKILEMSEINSEISATNTYVTKLQKDNEKIMSSDEEKKDAEKKLNLLLEDERNLSSSKEEIKENDSLYGLASVLLKDTGIKKRIISHYIPVINKVINSYLQQMNFFVLFELDEEFNEKIRSRHRDEFTYNSFSEGEKRKIDLALLFAWRRIAQMKNSVSTNLLILDEILDGSLDNTSTESFLDIIANLDKTTNLFVISHKPKEIIQDRFEKQITFVKKNNFSQIER